jgi:hypothetical protein
MLASARLLLNRLERALPAEPRDCRITSTTKSKLPGAKVSFEVTAKIEWTPARSRPTRDECEDWMRACCLSFDDQPSDLVHQVRCDVPAGERAEAEIFVTSCAIGQSKDAASSGDRSRPRVLAQSLDPRRRAIRFEKWMSNPSAFRASRRATASRRMAGRCDDHRSCNLTRLLISPVQNATIHVSFKMRRLRW